MAVPDDEADVPSTDLPDDFRLVFDPALRRMEGGRVLLGGSPLRLIRLSAAGARLVDSWADKTPVGATQGEQALARRLLDGGIAHPLPGTSPYTVEDVSVVIPVRDRAEQLSELLRRVGHVGEVIVIDDGSMTPIDGATLRHRRPRGPAAARNAGWRRAGLGLVAFVDSDCQPSRQWLERLLPHFADPRVAAVAPRVETAGGDGSVLARYERWGSPLDLGPSAGPVAALTRIGYVPTAALLVRRAVLEELAGFDETMLYGEDVDLVWRILDTGRAIRYEPSSVVLHPPRPQLSGWLRQRFTYGTSAAPLARRHPGRLAPLAASPWNLAAWLLTVLGYPRAGTAVVGVTVVTLTRRLRGLRHPTFSGLRLAGLGHLFAGRQIAAATTRAWWPAGLLAAVVSRRARRAVALTATVPYLVEWARRRPAIDPLRWTALRLLDDVTYGAGVWVGCVRERTLDPLVPDLAQGRREADAEPTTRVTSSSRRRR